MGFPSIYIGVLPLVVVNTAISLALVKNLVECILRIVGIKREPEQAPSVVDPREPWPATAGAADFDPAPNFIEEVQSTLPLIEFSPGDNTNDDDQGADQCAVCLSDFEAGQKVRQLPNCSHIFHRDCLDKWLGHNHTTCPMCRSTLLTEDLARKHKQQEEVLAEELAMWLSVYHSSGLSRGPWWYRGHGSSFGSWDFH